ncbi:MAG: hypothetical protein TEF_19380 [Rhizobiales bacterium NRL2]|jgi:protein ImuA|nr:MAG: hypothetical protein TEF_19380 [Rhizobiales bacterium NRL2]
MGSYRNIDRPARPETDAGDRERLAWLKRQLSDLAPEGEPWRPALPTGVAALDRHLPWGGLPLVGLHEIAGLMETGFALFLVRRLLAREAEDRPVLWCQTADGARERGRLYGPGLAGRGVDPARVLFVTAKRERDAQWAMEEALASGAVAAAVAETPAIGMTETRRLQLAAQKGKAMGLLLRGPAGDRAPGAALTRWRAEPLVPPESAGEMPLPGPLHLHLSLWRCRGGRAADWTLRHDEQTLCFDLAAPLADRSQGTA